MVYLICFDKKFHHARHYIGFCEDGNLQARIERHMSGHGSKLMAAVTEAGITWRVVHVWPDADRKFERKLHNRHGSRICPVCNAVEKQEAA